MTFGTPLTTGGFLLNGLRNGGMAVLEFDYIHAMQWLGDVEYAYACEQGIEAGAIIIVVELISR